MPVEAVYEPCTAGFGAPDGGAAGTLTATSAMTPAATPAIVVAHGFTGAADRPPYAVPRGCSPSVRP